MKQQKNTQRFSLVRFLFNPRAITVALMLAFLATIWWQSASDPWAAFESGLRGVRENNGSSVEAAIKALEGDNRYRLQLQLLKAYIALRDGNFPKAVELADEAKQHPDVTIEANVLAGEAAYVMGAAGNAKLYWEEALRRDGSNLSAHRWLGVLYFDLGAMDQSIMHLKIVSSLDTKDARPDRLMGLMNRDYERPEVAIPHYLESLKRAPKQADADQVRFELAECYFKLREYTNALSTLKLCADSPKHQVLQARCLLNTGEVDQSRKLALKAIESNQTPSLDALQLNAEIALADGEPAKSAEWLLQATKVDPHNHGVRTQLAQVFSRMNRPDESREQTQIAEDLQKKWQRFSDLQIDAINKPTNPDIRLEIGSLASQLGKPELARVWYKAALAINPRLQLAAQALSDLEVNSQSTPHN